MPEEKQHKEGRVSVGLQFEELQSTVGGGREAGVEDGLSHYNRSQNANGKRK